VAANSEATRGPRLMPCLLKSFNGYSVSMHRLSDQWGKPRMAQLKAPFGVSISLGTKESMDANLITLICLGLVNGILFLPISMYGYRFVLSFGKHVRSKSQGALLIVFGSVAACVLVIGVITLSLKSFGFVPLQGRYPMFGLSFLVGGVVWTIVGKYIRSQSQKKANGA
jgi:hypothetical protein